MLPGGHLMEELIELRHFILTNQYDKALMLIDELDEMSLQDTLNKIDSFMVVILIHLIKQEAEGKTTRSWDVSIANSARQINKTNKRRKTKGYYANRQDLIEIIDDAYPAALRQAALEAHEGKYSDAEIEEMIDIEQIKQKALALIDTTN